MVLPVGLLISTRTWALTLMMERAMLLVVDGSATRGGERRSWEGLVEVVSTDLAATDVREPQPRWCR